MRGYRRLRVAFVLTFVLLAVCLASAALAEDSDYRYEIRGGEAYITGYTGPSGAVSAPPYLEGAPVVSIYLKGTPAYITELSLPATIREIPENGLSGIVSLKTVRGLEYVQSVGGYAFSQTAVREAVFSSALRYVDTYAFSASLLKSITVPDDLPYVLYSFGGSFLLEEIRLVPGTGDKTLDVVDGVLFSADHSELVCYPPFRNGFSYRIPNGTKALAGESFNCIGEQLKELYIPESVTDIATYAFFNAQNTYTLYTVPGTASDDAVRQRIGADPIAQFRNASEFSSEGLLRSILDECLTGGMSNYDKALAIHDWIVENCEYDYSYTYGDGYQMLLYRKGVCQAYAEAFEMLATEAGLSCRLAGNFEHAFNAVDMGGGWAYVDCTWDDIGGSALDTHRYFGYERAVRYADYGPDYYDRLDYIIYSDVTSLDDASGKYHYFYRQGLLNDALSECEAKITALLSEGKTEFSFAVEASLTEYRDIGGRTLAALLSEEKWNVGGAEIPLVCAWTEGILLCIVPESAQAIADFNFSIGAQGVTILSYTGDDPHVVVPERIGAYPVTAIGEGAFLNNVGITRVTLPEGLTTIGGNAFSDCYRLSEINFPSTLKTIDNDAFFSCYSLKSDLVFSEGLKWIGAQAFQFCKSVTKLVVPSTASFGDCAFADNPMLSSVQLREGITVIAHSAFSGDPSLVSIDIPQTVSYIGNNAFYRTGLTRVHLPASLSIVCIAPFQECGALVSVTLDAGNPFLTIENDLLMDAEKTHVYFALPGVESITVPETVLSLSTRAFCSNKNLTSVHLPDAVTVIPEECFADCYALTDVRLGRNTTHIRYAAFRNCGLTNGIEFPNTLVSIGPSAFDGARLPTAVIPPSVVDIDFYAFRSEFCKLIIGQSGSAAEQFARNKGIPFAASQNPGAGSMKLPRDLTTVEAEAFAGSAISSVTCPQSLKRVESRAFADCANLFCVYMCDGVTYIAKDAFAGSEKVHIYAPNGSYAIAWAQENGVAHTVTDTTLIG